MTSCLRWVTRSSPRSASPCRSTRDRWREASGAGCAPAWMPRSPGSSTTSSAPGPIPSAGAPSTSTSGAASSAKGARSRRCSPRTASGPGWLGGGSPRRPATAGASTAELTALAEAIFAYIDEISAISAEGYAAEQAEAAGETPAPPRGGRTTAGRGSRQLGGACAGGGRGGLEPARDGGRHHHQGPPAGCAGHPPRAGRDCRGDRRRTGLRGGRGCGGTGPPERAGRSAGRPARRGRPRARAGRLRRQRGSRSPGLGAARGRRDLGQPRPRLGPPGDADRPRRRAGSSPTMRGASWRRSTRRPSSRVSACSRPSAPGSTTPAARPRWRERSTSTRRRPATGCEGSASCSGDIDDPERRFALALALRRADSRLPRLKKRGRKPI